MTSNHRTSTTSSNLYIHKQYTYMTMTLYTYAETFKRIRGLLEWLFLWWHHCETADRQVRMPEGSLMCRCWDMTTDEVIEVRPHHTEQLQVRLNCYQVLLLLFSGFRWVSTDQTEGVRSINVRRVHSEFCKTVTEESCLQRFMIIILQVCIYSTQ